MASERSEPPADTSLEEWLTCVHALPHDGDALPLGGCAEYNSSDGCGLVVVGAEPPRARRWSHCDRPSGRALCGRAGCGDSDVGRRGTAAAAAAAAASASTILAWVQRLGSGAGEVGAAAGIRSTAGDRRSAADTGRRAACAAARLGAAGCGVDSAALAGRLVLTDNARPNDDRFGETITGAGRASAAPAGADGICGTSSVHAYCMPAPSHAPLEVAHPANE